MKSKLFKHEFKRTAKWLGLVALAAALLVGVSLIAAFLLPAPFNTVLAALGLFIAIGTPMAVQLLLGLDFYRSSYSKTGYFTMTLPVRGATTFWVKFGYAALVAVAFVLYGLLLTFLNGFGLYQSLFGTTAGYVQSITDGIRMMLDYLPAWLVVVGLVIAILIPLSGIAHYYFAATVGSENTFNRLGFGGVVLVWFLFYLASQLASLIGIFLPLNLLIEPSGIGWAVNPMAVFNSESDGILPLGAFVTMLLLAAVALWRAKVSFEEKVELR